MPARSVLRLSVALLSFGSVTLPAQTRCENLSAVVLPDARVLQARSVEAGKFAPPDLKPGSPEGALYKKLPRFCRVQVESTPSRDSQIAIEVWLPFEHWNHKFRGQGNGGFAGALDYHGMGYSLSLGFLTAATDTGHKGEATDSNWALGHPEKIKDFGYRAIHEMTGAAKLLAVKFYGKDPQRSYFDSCSDGGREALMEAQRFPGDYDGILAGAPANNWTHLLTAGLQAVQVETASPANFIPPAKLPLITRAALRACDANDGVRDGILNDPSRCHFDPESLRCKSASQRSCLTGPQVATLKQIYRGAITSTGQMIFPGLMPSGEAGKDGWEAWVTGTDPRSASGHAYTEGFFRNMVFDDPNWSYRDANVDSALKAADQKLSAVLNATDPNLSAFRARGGKLILYHGWLDPAISPLGTIDYYRSVVATMGQKSAETFVRLYMVPGMRHCAGGPGPFIFGQLGIASSRDSAHNVFTALEEWVEQDTAPGSIITTKFIDENQPSKGIQMTRPLCPYPQESQYIGRGSTNDAESFRCASPRHQ